MIKLIKRFLNWLTNSEVETTRDESYYAQPVNTDIVKEPYEGRNFMNDSNFENYSRLQSEKYKALTACNGCEEEVFVLKKDGTELGYYPNLNQLAVKNNLVVSTVYRYWKQKDTRKSLYLDKYEIINYKEKE